jgi:hypothetical protein
MSKFTIKVKLQGLEIEVEGTREDAPRIASQLGKQIGGLLQAPATLASGNGSSVLEAEVIPEDGAGKKKRIKKPGGGGRAPSELLSFTHDSSAYGSPVQGWTTAQKALWFLYIAGKQANVTQLTATNVAKNFNSLFRAAGIIHSGNVGQGLEKERLKGTNATVNADTTDGTAKYFLTQTGTTIAERLARGESVKLD